jgi:hypothetical protein
VSVRSSRGRESEGFCGRRRVFEDVRKGFGEVGKVFNNERFEGFDRERVEFPIL